MAVEFGWWPMSPWLSPGAAWFIFFNVLVGAIAVMSSRGQKNGGAPESGTRRRLVRTASTVVLDSLRSISIFPFHSADTDYSVAYSAPAPQLHHVQDRHHTFQEQQPQAQKAVPQLLREPDAPSSEAQEECAALPVAAPRASAAASESQVEDDGGSSISLDEAYALARARRQSPAATDTVTRMPEIKEPVAEAKARPYGCRRGTEEVEGKAEVNARAEQFIRQFRNELKLERINSILNYTHALRRGAGAAPPAPR